MSSNPITVIPPQVEHLEDTSMVVVRILTGEEELLNTGTNYLCLVIWAVDGEIGAFEERIVNSVIEQATKYLSLIL